MRYHDPSGHDGKEYLENPSSENGQSRVEQVDGEVGNVAGGMEYEDSTGVQDKFNELLNSDYYKNNFGFDCSEIAQEFYDVAGQQGKIYRIEGINGYIYSYEYGYKTDYYYHEVYSDGTYVYDPRYSNEPILKDDYFKSLREINPDGFDVFEKKIRVIGMKDIDKCIAVVINEKIPIEWMRFNMYIEDDIYRNIPMLVFRVKENCSPNLIDNLKKCVKDFHGTVIWKVFKDPLSRKGNYLLTISELEVMRKNYKDSRNEYNEKEYFGIEQFMKLCELAIEDIPLLAQHIDKKLCV